jgi:hypothetical protein
MRMADAMSELPKRRGLRRQEQRLELTHPYAWSMAPTLHMVWQDRMLAVPMKSAAISNCEVVLNQVLASDRGSAD